MAKQSFFKRLTGSLNLDELDENTSLDTRELLTHKEEEISEIAIDMHETPREILVQAFIAGVPGEHLSITITRDSLHISGKREGSKTIQKDPHIEELYWGAFERYVDLPAEVEVDESEALEKHGMLIIKMPKIDKTRKSVLKVKAI